MKLSLEEWQFLTNVLMEKGVNIAIKFGDLEKLDNDIMRRWEIYADIGEYVHDIKDGGEATEQERIWVDHYDSLMHEQGLLNQVKRKFRVEAEL